MAGFDRAVGPLLLDITRSVGRAGVGAPTGIDRVELAYVQAVAAAGGRFLCRTTRGHLLIDPEGALTLADTIRRGAAPGRADWLSRLFGRGANLRHRAEAMLRPFAVARATPGRLDRLIARHVPQGGIYLNVGHANLTARTFGAMAKAGTLRRVVMIHDIIPISHPALVAEGQPARFAERLARVRAGADLILANSQATRDALLDLWRDGTAPPIRVAPLGLDPAPPLPPGPAPIRDPRHIVMLGTIEPRKNHELALAVWEILAERRAPEGMPHLHIIGRAGWQIEGLMARLHGHSLNGRFLHLHGPLPEAETAAHLARAGALLYPSLAEGFGYPPLEALRAGALPICSALPVFRETLGSSAVYVPDFETYSWVERIEKYLDGSLPRPDPDAARGLDWAAHFGIVAQALAETERRKGPG